MRQTGPYLLNIINMTRYDSNYNDITRAPAVANRSH